MSGKRPTDHLEPAAKKRGADRDINKDNYEEEEDKEVEAGSFQRADAEVLKQRKIVKARRNPAAATTTTPNPFANIKLAPGATIAPPAANPSASTTLAPPPKPEDRNEEEVKERLTTNGAAAAATEVEKKEEEKRGEQQPSTKPSGFGAFAASSGGLLFGSSKSTGGFRGFSGDAVAGSAAIGGGAGIFGFGSASTTAAAGAAPSVFGSTKSVGFGALSSAGTGTGGTTGIFGVGGGATTTAAAAGPATGEGEEEEKEKEEAPAAPAPNNVFGATTTTTTITNTRNTPSAALPEEQPAATGEEHEDVVYSVDGVLFEFDLVEKAWKERGRGEVRVLVHSATSAGRVVMRQKGNLRLLLNANLWKEMHLNRMDGGKGVTFAVVNHALVGDGEENGGGGGGPLATYAFRVKTEDLLEKFIEAVDSHKGGRLINV